MAGGPTCPRCGGTVPSDAPQGLCPICLVEFALGDAPAGIASLGASDVSRAIPPGPVGRIEVEGHGPGHGALHDEPTLAPNSPADVLTIARSVAPDAPTE